MGMATFLFAFLLNGPWLKFYMFRQLNSLTDHSCKLSICSPFCYTPIHFVRFCRYTCDHNRQVSSYLKTQLSLEVEDKHTEKQIRSKAYAVSLMVVIPLFCPYLQPNRTNILVL